MSLSSKEQELYDQALKTLPSWVRGDDRAMEDLGQAAKIAGSADDQGDYWSNQALITTATGPVGGAPDWLAAHARDRATDRQVDETDPTLRARLRTIEDSVTRPALLAAAQAIIDAAGVVGDVAGLELPRDAAFNLVTSRQTGTGGAFTDETGTTVGFEPTVAFTAIPYHPHPEPFTYKITFSGSAHSANNGTFTIAGLLVNRVLFTNASGVFEVDASVAWSIEKYDAEGNRVDGYRDSYSNRGDRSIVFFEFIIILPYGTDEATQAAVEDMVRLKKGFGYPFHVERRLNA